MIGRPHQFLIYIPGIFAENLSQAAGKFDNPRADSALHVSRKPPLGRGLGDWVRVGV